MKKKIFGAIFICVLIIIFAGILKRSEDSEEIPVTVMVVPAKTFWHHEPVLKEEIIYVEDLEERLFGHPQKYILVEDENGKWFENQEGEKVSEVYEDAFEFEAGDYFARVMEDGKWYVVDTEFEHIVPYAYDMITEFSALSFCYSGLIDGKVVITNASLLESHIRTIFLEDYSSISPVRYENYCIVQGHDGKYGMIYLTGEVLVQPKYQSLEMSDLLEDNSVVLTTESFDGHYGAVIYNFYQKYVFEIPSVYDEELLFSQDGSAKAIRDGITQTINLEYDGDMYE